MSCIGTYIVPKYIFHILVLLDMFHFFEMLDLPEMLDLLEVLFLLENLCVLEVLGVLEVLDFHLFEMLDFHVEMLDLLDILICLL